MGVCSPLRNGPWRLASCITAPEAFSGAILRQTQHIRGQHRCDSEIPMPDEDMEAIGETDLRLCHNKSSIRRGRKNQHILHLDNGKVVEDRKVVSFLLSFFQLDVTKGLPEMP